jgi:hypothetical protein
MCADYYGRRLACSRQAGVHIIELVNLNQRQVFLDKLLVHKSGAFGFVEGRGRNLLDGYCLVKDVIQ